MLFITKCKLILKRCSYSSDFRSKSTNQIRSLSFMDLNPNAKAIQYSIRGPLLTKALEIDDELRRGIKKPFEETIKANVGDCHATGQDPLTFIRQVLCLISYPVLLEDSIFPDDAKQRARNILNALGGSVGSYTQIGGLEMVRRHVAEFIESRDGFPSDWRNVVLTSGASDGIASILKLLISPNKRHGVMVPVPEFPAYSATLSKYGLKKIDYFLEEEKGWDLDVYELQKTFDKAQKTCAPKILVVVNPGNPTGHVLSKGSIAEFIKFAYKNNLLVIADEVYQENVYQQGCKFHSFKKVSSELGEPYCNLELASLMSCSKGYAGERGIRGGYVEITNMCPKVWEVYFKSLSLLGCPPVHGQVVIDCIVKPPNEGDPSCELFVKEKNVILNSLKMKAKLTHETLSTIEGYSCEPIQGALYAFPRFKLPLKAVEAAQSANLAPDAFYAMALLEKTGIFVVPGSSFGQKPDTYHFRTTILPPLEKMKVVLHRLKKFHEKFVETYQ